MLKKHSVKQYSTNKKKIKEIKQSDVYKVDNLELL